MRISIATIFFLQLACTAADKDSADVPETDTVSEIDTDTDADSQSCGTVHTVRTTDNDTDFEVYMDFAPENLTISVGDCVSFEMSTEHNAVEVSQETYDNRQGSALEGGFSVGFGATKEVYFGEAGIHYYVCQPHVTMDMVGTITVQ